MPTVICPECDESVTLPATSKSVRCPGCGTKIGSRASEVEPADEDDPDEQDERDEKRARKRLKKKKGGKSARASGRAPGVLPLVIFGPICALLAIWAPFSGYGTVLSMLVGALILFVADIVIGIALYRDPEWHDEVTSLLVRLFPILLVIISIRATLADPRRFRAWMALSVIGLVTMSVGITAQTVWKTMDDGPGKNGREKAAQPGPNAPGEQQPGAVPNPPPVQPTPPPPPDPSAVADKAISTALANLDQPDDFARSGAAADLGRMTPKDDRRTEVVQKLTELAADPGPASRVEAVKALGVWGTKDDVPTLIRALDHEDGATRRAAALAVRRFRDERAIPVLVRRLADTQCTGESAKALIDIGSAVEKSVIPSLSSTDTTEQGAAIDVLKEVGTANSVPALQKVVASKSFWGNKAAEALKLINARSKKKK
jgi:HEAT repeat protein